MASDSDKGTDKIGSIRRPEVPSYHPDYNDPSADMVIRCEDGTRMRVQACILKANSLYFRHMPEDTSGLTGDREGVVDLPVNSEHFVSLLRLLDRQTKRPDISWSEMEAVLKIGARYEFVAVPDFALIDVGRDMHDQSAWPIFRFASQQRFFALAKFAVSHFHQVNLIAHASPETFYVALLRDIPGDYSAALMRAIAEHAPEKPANNRWMKISGSFTL